MSSFNKNAWYRQLVGAVSPRAFAIGFALVETYLFKGQTECWSSQENLGRLANASARTVRDALKELEEAGFLTHRRGGKGHANRYVPHFVDRQKFADQTRQESCDDRQNLAYDDRQDFAADIAEQQLEGVGPSGAPADTSAYWTQVKDRGPATSPPPAPVGPVGDVADPADAKGSSSSDVPLSASNLAVRIEHLETELGMFRDDDGELQRELPRIVRSFYLRDQDPSPAAFAEIESAFRRWRLGDWCELATDDELLLEHARRRAAYGRYERDSDEDELGAWDRTAADDDDELRLNVSAPKEMKNG